jgi:hypothetical protein
MSQFKHIISKAAVAGTFLLCIAGVASTASARETFCQANGHGASGCDLGGNATGYCWANRNSPTGYYCKEEKPTQSIAPGKDSAINKKKKVRATAR